MNHVIPFQTENSLPAAAIVATSVGIYVHIPFCHHRCTYCDFNIYAGMRSLYERYARAVASEIAARSSSVPFAALRGSSRDDSYRAATIYFGGGTPSLFPCEHIALILEAIRGRFEVEPDAEISLEANPRTEEDGYLSELRTLGVNRLSLGMQSAIERDLHLFRRGHTFEDVAQSIRIARAAGFDNLNLDLIYGIPRQSLDDWRVTLEAALSLEPEHISAYGLQVEDGTTLKKWIAQGAVPAPDDDLAADMFDLAEAMLEEAGFVHYEISNWARGQSSVNSGQLSVSTEHCALTTGNCLLASQHNLTYWRNQAYLGFGCGAHSWFGGRRPANVRHPRAYTELIEAGQGVEAESESISRELEMGETMMLGLRLLDEGVTFNRFASRFGVDLRDIYGRQIERLTRIGLVELDVERIRLTRQGRLVANRAFAEFLPA